MRGRVCCGGVKPVCRKKPTLAVRIGDAAIASGELADTWPALTCSQESSNQVALSDGMPAWC